MIKLKDMEKEMVYERQFRLHGTGNRLVIYLQQAGGLQE